jgi:tetratricopeptide (TPR) repeat protein
MAVNPAVSRDSNRFALIIATSEYQDTDLRKLIAPGQDAKALSNVLGDPKIGSFSIKIIANETSSKTSEEIEAFFSERSREDVLLLYFSCHGFKDVDGRLYFASTNTRRKLLRATAIPANFVNEVMERCRSKRQVLVLDCCYSGAFAKGLLHKASDKSIHTGDQFEGKGRVVLTASDSMQYSFEGDTLEGHGQHSVFTSALINGLETGEADIDKNGRISYHELYNYAFEHVRKETPLQNPGIWVFGVEGDVVIANNPNEIVDPNDLVQEALESLKKDYFNDAIESCDRAIKINPRIALAHNIKGLAYFNIKQYSEALACYDIAIRLRPKYTEALVTKGLTLAALGDHEKAVESFSDSISLNPNDKDAWNYKGISLDSL